MAVQIGRFRSPGSLQRLTRFEDTRLPAIEFTEGIMAPRVSRISQAIAEREQRMASGTPYRRIAATSPAATSGAASMTTAAGPAPIRFGEAGPMTAAPPGTAIPARPMTQGEAGPLRLTPPLDAEQLYNAQVRNLLREGSIAARMLSFDESYGDARNFYEGRIEQLVGERGMDRATAERTFAEAILGRGQLRQGGSDEELIDRAARTIEQVPPPGYRQRGMFEGEPGIERKPPEPLTPLGMAKETGKGALRALEWERETIQPYTKPVLRRAGEQLTRTLTDVPWVLRKAGVPSLPGAERRAEIGGEVAATVGGEVALPSNLIPIPFIDPLVGRLLSAPFRALGGKTASREAAERLIADVARVAADPATSAETRTAARRTEAELRRLVAERPVAGAAEQTPYGLEELKANVARRVTDRQAAAGSVEFPDTMQFNALEEDVKGQLAQGRPVTREVEVFLRDYDRQLEQATPNLRDYHPDRKAYERAIQAHQERRNRLLQLREDVRAAQFGLEEAARPAAEAAPEPEFVPAHKYEPVPKIEAARRRQEMLERVRREAEGAPVPVEARTTRPAEPTSGTVAVATADDAIDDAARVAQRTERAHAGGGGPGEPPAIDTQVPDPAGDPLMMRVEGTDALYHLRLRLGKANSEAAAFGDAFRYGERTALEIDENGLVRGVTPKKEGLPTHWNDVFADPDAYNGVTKPMRQYMDRWYQVQRAKTEQLVEAGILSEKLLEGEGRWVKRVVVSIDDEAVRVGPRGRTGTKQSFELPRTREYAGQAGGRAIRYATPADTLEIFLKEADKRIADAEFAQRINRFGKTPAQRINAALKLNRIDALRERNAARAALNREKKKLVREQGRISGRKQVSERARAGPRLVAAQERVTAAQARMDQAGARLKQATAAKAQAMRIARRPSGPKEAYLPEPFASSRIFPREFAQHIERGLELPRYGWQGNVASLLKVMGDANAILKPLQASTDLSLSGLQALPALGSNPKAYAEMQRVVFASLLDPSNYYRYMDENLALAREIVEHGGQFYGNEFSFDAALAGPGGAQMERLLRILKPMKLGNDAWNRGLNVLTIEQYKLGKAMAEDIGEGAWSRLATKAFGGKVRGAEAKDQLVDVIMHGTGRMSLPEMAKQGPMQSALFRALPFAGRYWTGWSKLIVDAARSGMRGHMARRQIAGWAASGIGLYALLAQATGQDIHLDPRKPSEFMTLKVGGTKVGVGGPLQQFMVLAGKIAEDPGSAHEIAARFARGKASPILSMAVDLITRETYMGEPLETWQDVARYMATQPLPFIGQEVGRAALERDWEEVKEEAKAAPGTGLGLRSWPVSDYEKLQNAWKAKHPQEFNPETDYRLVNQDPGLEKYVRHSEVYEARQAVLAEREKELLPAAQAALAGDEEAGARFREQWSDFGKFAWGTSEMAYPDQDFDEPKTPEGKLVKEYYAVEMPVDPETGEEDYDTWEQQRKRILGEIRKIRPELAESIEEGMQPQDPTLKQAVAELNKAKKLRDELSKIPQVKTLTPEQHEEVKDFLAEIPKARAFWLDEYGITYEEMGLEQAIRFLGKQWKKPELFIENAVAIRGGIPDRLRTEEYDAFLIKHGEQGSPLRVFYPYLYKSQRVRLLLREAR